MKMNRIKAAVGNLLVALSILGGYARAQIASFRVSIPFDFITGHATLPAGNYIFQRLLGRPRKQDTVGIIVLRSTDRQIYRAIVTSLAAQPPGSGTSDSKIVFRRSLGRHYLDQVWISGDEAVHVLTTVPRGLETTLEDTTDVITMARLR
jgi:hypothetical protein